MEVMKPEREFYYVLFDLHGPEEIYQPVYEVLNNLRAQKLDGGFPVWRFFGEKDAHQTYRMMFEPLLPPISIYQPEIRYSFLLMSARGYTSFGEYNPSVA
jgi:hypothetical protein